jgi:hypothetical protein
VTFNTQSAVTEKTGLPLPSEIIAGVIDGLLIEEVSASQFVAGLEAAGIDVRPNIASTGRVSGLAYSLGGVPVTAKAMGHAYTWSQLQRRGLKYDEARDLPMLRAARERSLRNDTSMQLESSVDGSPGDRRSSPAEIAAHAFAAAAVAEFMQAAGTDAFMVFHAAEVSTGVSFKEIRDLMDSKNLHQMLRGGLLNAEVRADVLDPRIVVISELGESQIADLNKHGLQPFAVTETSPSVFEACIRLAPSNEPEPLRKERAEAAAAITRIVGGRVSNTVALPGFINPKLRARHGRRLVTMLRHYGSVVAERGAALLAYAKKQLAAAVRELKPSVAEDVTPDRPANPIETSHAKALRGVPLSQGIESSPQQNTRRTAPETYNEVDSFGP